MSAATVWAVILLLAAGSYLIRLSFLGLVGGRQLPGWLMAPLRYTTVAVLPALVAPAVAWPAATGGQTDPVRLAAALCALAVGVIFRSTLAGVAAGFAAFALGLWAAG